MEKIQRPRVHVDVKSLTQAGMGQYLDHLERFFRVLASGRHFALTRYADGESAILQNLEISSIGTNRHWCFRPSQGIGDSSLSVDLAAAFDFDDPSYYVGISDPCCDPGAYGYYIDRLGDVRANHRTTYSNLFANGNWKYLHARFQGLLTETRRQIILVSNWDKDYRRARSALPYNCVDVAGAGSAFYDQPIPNKLGEGYFHGGCTLWYCQNREQILKDYRALARSVSNAIFLVQLGPIADILIHQMFLQNPANTYLDMGHSLDGILYGEPSRGYMIGEGAKMCADMDATWDL